MVDAVNTLIEWEKLDNAKVKVFQLLHIYPKNSSGEKAIFSVADLVHELKRGDEEIVTRGYTDMDDQSVGVTVTPKAEGPHVLSIGFKQHTGDGDDDFVVVPFARSPYHFVVAHNDKIADWTQSLVLDLPSKAVVNEDFTFSVHLKNSEGRLVDEPNLPFDITVRFAEWGSLGWSRGYQDEGISKIWVTPTEAGRHELTVSIDGHALAPTPHVLTVVANASEL